MRKIISKNYYTEQVIRQKLEENLNNGREVYRFYSKIVYPIIRNFHETEDAVQNSLMKFWEKAGYYKYPVEEKIPLLEDQKIRTFMWEIGKNSAIDVIKERDKFRKAHILHSNYFFKKDGYTSNRKNTLLEELAVSEETPVSLAINSEKKKFIVKTIHELPEPIRGIVEMFYYGGKKYSEMAEELSVPIGTVKSRLNRAKRILRKKLKKYFYR